MTNLKYASSSTQRSRLLIGGEINHFAPFALLENPDLRARNSFRLLACKGAEVVPKYSFL